MSMIRTLVLLLDEGVHVDWCYSAQEVNVVVRVELCHLAFGSRFGSLQS